jgi:hypothetical protein
MISKGAGFVHEKDDHWCAPKLRNCGPPWLAGTLFVRADKPAAEAMARTGFGQQMAGASIPPARLSRVGPHSANVSVRQNPRAGSTTLAIAQNYAHVFADKLRAHVPAVRTELPF